jgi:hypothetical protein
MDVEELYRRYAAGERDFPGVDLSHADLNVAGVTYIEEVESDGWDIGSDCRRVQQ